jgi:hypothetical protein
MTKANTIAEYVAEYAAMTAEELAAEGLTAEWLEGVRQMLEQMRQACEPMIKPLDDMAASFRETAGVLRQFGEAAERDPVLKKIRQGEESPNTAERKRFSSLLDQMGDKTLPELREWFDQVTPPEGHVGRKRGVELYPGDQAVVEKMLPLMRGGMCGTKAAGLFEHEVPGASPRSRIDRLRRKARKALAI